jgi:putative ABC transport system ATP-binding protein
VNQGLHDERQLMTDLIEADAIGRRDPRSRDDGWLIRGVSLSVSAGDRLGVLGPSGAGKTVLLRALALLDPLDEGSIRSGGSEVRGHAVPDHRRRVTYLHQRPALLDGTVEENLRYPFTLQVHRGRSFDLARVEGLLARLGREPGFLAKNARDLSGGESQLAGLVRALQLDPAVLLLDEPTASLDAATARVVEALLDQWLAAEPSRRAMVWVSHDADQARRMTRRRVFLRAGRLESEETD